MSRQLYLRMASAALLVALAFIILGLDPMLGADPTAGFAVSTPAVSVDRSLKGDRLPVGDPAISVAPDWQHEFSATPETGRAHIPIGCDPSFSPISSASAAGVYGRCVA